MADLQFAVRKLEKEFYEQYYLEIFEQVKLIPEDESQNGILVQYY